MCRYISLNHLLSIKHFGEDGDGGLSDSEGEDQLRTNDQDLGSQALDLMIIGT
jgi:hypothetical protein